ncbi:MAG: ParB N-terminal domain-containing protein [Paracoccaceae bacterium]|nr:ParB N-terminal domain-containing protein [Paracoccaceae bacterium]
MIVPDTSPKSQAKVGISINNQCVKRKSKRVVRLQEIETRPKVFQFRHCELDDRHVTGLLKALQNGQTLDPLTLWKNPDTEALVLVDGHHRLAAYAQINWTKKVPTVIHHCDLAECDFVTIGHPVGKSGFSFVKPFGKEGVDDLAKLGRHFARVLGNRLFLQIDVFDLERY